MEKLYFAKVKENAVIPTKRVEDAGYDMYACFEEDFMTIDTRETVLVPLGISTAFSSDYVMLLKERGSTGTKGMAQRCGVIDSGYRGEYMAPITNTSNKSIIIAKKEYLDKLKKLVIPCPYKANVQQNAYEQLSEMYTIYPYEKAICQGVLVVMPQLETEEIDYLELMTNDKFDSSRGSGKLGSSGK